MQCALGHSTSREVRSPYLAMARAIPPKGGPFTVQQCYSTGRGASPLPVGKTYFWYQYDKVRMEIGAVPSNREYFCGSGACFRSFLSAPALGFLCSCYSSHRGTCAPQDEPTFTFAFDDRQTAKLAIVLRQDILIKRFYL